jgi:DNA polymerase-1
MRIQNLSFSESNSLVNKVYSILEDDVEFPKLEDLKNHPDFEGIETADDTFELIDTEEDFLQCIEEMMSADIISPDTETDGLMYRRHSVCGYSFSYKKDGGRFSSTADLRNVYIPVRHRTGDTNIDPEFAAYHINRVVQARKDRLWLYWNASFDWQMMYKEGIDIPHRYIDGYIMFKCIMPGELAALKYVASNYIEKDAGYMQFLVKLYINILQRKNKQFQFKKKPYSPSLYNYVPTKIMGKYAAKDTYYTWKVIARFINEIQKAEDVMDLFVNETVAALIFFEMEYEGVCLNKGKYIQNKKYIEEEVEKIKSSISNKDEGQYPNIRSPRALAKVFKDHETPILIPFPETANLPPQRWYPATSTAHYTALSKAGYPLGDSLLAYNEYMTIEKALKSIEPYIESDGRIHPHFNQMGTKTGRASTKDPNINGLPQGSKYAYLVSDLFEVPQHLKDDWVIVKGDLSQIDLRMIANLSKDPLMMQAFINNEDQHTLTARHALRDEWSEQASAEIEKNLRRIGKKMNFSIIYGISPQSLATSLSKEGFSYSVEECQELIHNMKESRPVMMEWIEQVKARAYRDGFLCNSFGRYIDAMKLKDPNTHFKEKSAIERTLVNFLVQSDSADFFKRCLVRFKKDLNKKSLDSKFFNSVYDSLFLYARKDQVEEVKATMKDSFESCGRELFDVPIVLDIG